MSNSVRIFLAFLPKGHPSISPLLNANLSVNSSFPQYESPQNALIPSFQANSWLFKTHSSSPSRISPCQMDDLSKPTATQSQSQPIVHFSEAGPSVEDTATFLDPSQSAIPLPTIRPSNLDGHQQNQQSTYFDSPFSQFVGGDQPLLRLLAVVGLLFILGLYLLHLVAIIYGRHRLHKQAKAIAKCRVDQQKKMMLPKTELPGVTILKPLVGVDDNLADNLQSFFQLDYPKFELLFCLDSTQDPALDLVQKLCVKYPSVDARIFVGGERVGLNPKINNMYPGYSASRYPLVLVSDQGILMRSEALFDMVLCQMERPDIALVTQTPFCANRPGIGAALEQIYFGGAHSRIYLASHAFRFVCSTGMSSLMAKEAIEECGGFKQFGAYLAEDYFLGQAFAKIGYRNVISHLPALQNSANCSVRVFQERICRWIKLRIAMLPHTILLEPAQECVVSSVIGALSISQLFGIQLLPFFLLFHFIYWSIGDFILLRTIQNGPLPFSPPKFFLCWLFREFMAFPIFVKAVLNPHIGWRFGTYRLCWGGRIKAAKEN